MSFKLSLKEIENSMGHSTQRLTVADCKTQHEFHDIYRQITTRTSHKFISDVTVTLKLTRLILNCTK